MDVINFHFPLGHFLCSTHRWQQVTTLLNRQASSQSLSGPCVVKLWQREECGRRQITTLEHASVVGDAALPVKTGEVCSVLILIKFKGRTPVALKKWSRSDREACGLGIAQSVPFVLCLNSLKLRIMKWKFSMIIHFVHLVPVGLGSFSLISQTLSKLYSGAAPMWILMCTTAPWDWRINLQMTLESN